MGQEQPTVSIRKDSMGRWQMKWPLKDELKCMYNEIKICLRRVGRVPIQVQSWAPHMDPCGSPEMIPECRNKLRNKP